MTKQKAVNLKVSLRMNLSYFHSLLPLKQDRNILVSLLFKLHAFPFAAQIRRLYDIANILTSLDLIRKVHVTEVRGRKPAFKYVGPTVEDLAEPAPSK